MHNTTYGYVTLFKMYVKSGSSRIFLATTFIVLVLAQVATSGCDYWLGYWTELEDQRDNRTLHKRNVGNSSGKCDCQKKLGFLDQVLNILLTIINQVTINTFFLEKCSKRTFQMVPLVVLFLRYHRAYHINLFNKNSQLIFTSSI